MAKEEFVHLLHSESVIAQMAATVFTGLIHKPEYAAMDEGLLVQKSVAIAIRLAQETEKAVKSDQEWMQKDQGSAFLAG